MTLKDILESGLNESNWFFLTSNMCLNQLIFKLKHTNNFLNLVILLFENDLFLFVGSLLNPILWYKIIQG